MFTSAFPFLYFEAVDNIRKFVTLSIFGRYLYVMKEAFHKYEHYNNPGVGATRFRKLAGIYNGHYFVLFTI